MNLLFIGHLYHKKTKSSRFISELLKKKYDVDELYFDPDNMSTYDMSGYRKSYDVLLIWQIMPNVEELKKIVSWNRGVFFPMYDHYYLHGGLFLDIWSQYREFNVISFSRTLYNDLRRNGFSVHYIQYFPKPAEVKDWGEQKSMYFWPRLDMVNLETISEAIPNVMLEKLHIHKALDPKKKVRPLRRCNKCTKSFFRGTKITETKWFEKKDEMLSYIQKSALYMAPRHYEGIGMSFLEAMALGRCVIAPDNPTMNEYIQDGKNGFLYPWTLFKRSHCAAPSSLTEADIREVQHNAYQSIVEGHKHWEEQKHLILDWIEEDVCVDVNKQKKCSLGCGWENLPIAEQKWLDVSVLQSELHEKKPLLSVLCEHPDLTVVTVCYNVVREGRKEQFVQNMDSVQKQTGLTLEHVIIDGGSVDGTLDIIKDYENQVYPIRYISKNDDGIYDAMNRGLSLSKGRYVIFLNTDDFYHSESGLSEAIKNIDEHNCTFSFSPIDVLENKDKHNPHLTPLKYLDSVFQHAVFSHQSLIVRRDTMLELHGFDISYRSAADYDFVLRLLISGHKGYYFPKSFASFRMTGLSTVNAEQSCRETGLVFKRLYNSAFGSTLSAADGYRFHMVGKLPRKDRFLQRKFRRIVKNAFENCPLQLQDTWLERIIGIFAK